MVLLSGFLCLFLLGRFVFSLFYGFLFFQEFCLVLFLVPFIPYGSSFPWTFISYVFLVFVFKKVSRVLNTECNSKLFLGSIINNIFVAGAWIQISQSCKASFNLSWVSRLQHRLCLSLKKQIPANMSAWVHSLSSAIRQLLLISGQKFISPTMLVVFVYGISVAILPKTITKLMYTLVQCSSSYWVELISFPSQEHISKEPDQGLINDHWYCYHCNDQNCSIFLEF